MGRKIDVASFLCGAFKKNPPQKTIENPKKDDPVVSTVGSPSHGGGDDDVSPDQKPQPTITEQQNLVPPTTNIGTTTNIEEEDEEVLMNKPLQPPPGRLQPQMRASSYHQQRSSRSISAVSKLSASLSVRAALGRHEEKEGDKNKKKLKHEDSVWKKTIILGEKCRVPDQDDDDTILYYEKGNRISTYHPKNNVGNGSVRSVSRQNSGNSQGLADLCDEL